MKFLNTGTPYFQLKETNVILMVDTQALPQDLTRLRNDGNNWCIGVLGEDISVQRFTPSTDPSGNWLTFLNTGLRQKAKRDLHLPEGNTADFRHNGKVFSGTTMAFSEVPDSKATQMYFYGSGTLIWISSSRTV